MSYAMVSGGDALPLPEYVDFDSAMTQLSHVNEALHRSQIMTGSVNPDSMTGEMVEAWKREVEKLTGTVRRVGGMIHAVVQAIDSYKYLYRQTITDVKGMQEEWDGDIRAFKVIDVLGEGATKDERKKLEDKQFELAGRYNRRIEELDSEAETLSKKIESILGDLAPSAGKVGAGAGRRPDRNDLGVALFGGGGILGAQTMAANAEADAADLSRLVSDVDEDGVPTKKALEEMKKKGYLDRLGTDPYFCAAVAAKINPKRMADLGRKIDEKVRVGMVVNGPSSARFDQLGGRAEDLQRLYGGFGASVMVATGSVPRGLDGEAKDTWETWKRFSENGGVSMKVKSGTESMGQWRKDYLESIKAAGREGAKGGAEMFHFNRDTRGYVHLGQMFGLGAKAHPELTFSNEFVNGKGSVMHDLLKWDREQKADYRASYKDNAYVQMVAKYGNFSTFEGLGSRDPVANMMYGMDGDPKVSREFLASEVDVPGNKDPNVARYLVGSRYALSHGASAYVDHGEQLGHIVDEATSGKDAVHDPRTFTAIRGYLQGYTEGLRSGGINGSDPGQSLGAQGEPRFGAAHYGLRSWTGQILKEYTDDLARELTSPSGVQSGDGAVYDVKDKRYRLVLPASLVDDMTLAKRGLFTDLAFENGVRDTQITGLHGRPPALLELANKATQGMYRDGVEAWRVDSKYGQHVVGRYGALLSHLELAEYNADVNVGEVKDKSHSNVRGLINHLTSAIPAGKVPGGSQAFQATQDAAFNKWLSLDNRAEAVSDRDNAVETIANGLTESTPDGKYSPVDAIKVEAQRQNKYLGEPKTHFVTLEELYHRLPKEENFVDENYASKHQTDPQENEAFRFNEHSYWSHEGRKRVPGVTNMQDQIDKAFDGSLRDSK
mgnify:CR=1 FL=1